MPKIIFTADDYGCLNKIDIAIRNAIREDAINSVAVISNGLNVDQGLIDLKKITDEKKEQGKIVDVGCHLTITCGRPLTNDILPHFKNRHGAFREFTDLKRKGTFSADTRDKVKHSLFKELNAQIEVVKKFFTVKHLSSHHNALIYFPEYLEVLIDLARYHKCKIRSPFVVPKLKQNLFILQLQLRSRESLDPVDSFKLEEFSRNIGNWIDKRRIVPPEIMKVNEFEVSQADPDFPGMPDCIDGTHYGPLPPANLSKSSGMNRHDRLPTGRRVDLERLFIKKAKNKADKLFKHSINKLGDNETVEYAFHLIDHDDPDTLGDYIQTTKEALNDPKNDNYFPGLDANYFDSRAIEYRSLLNYVRKRNIKLTNWDEI